MTVPVLDTHAWVEWIVESPGVTAAARKALDGFAPDQRPYLSTISLWEVAMLVDLKRLVLDVPLTEWLSLAAHPRTVRLVPISPVIAAGTAALPSTFHRDPADRIIVATCLALDAPLMTDDERIRRSRLIRRWKPTADSAGPTST
ncbi:MAG: type II toxin-antitoxin system VapC family toxin [Acidobacteria bacterium]|nr:type II toxin-antitoxin system VapC family toxin [Acidobacteriota bacterium]